MRFARRRPLAPALVLWLFVAAVNADGPRDVLEVDGRRPIRAVVATADTIDVRTLVDAEMARRLAGVMADLDRRKINRLFSCVDERPPPASVPYGETFGYMHLFGPSNERVLRINTVPGGYVVFAADDPSRRAMLRPDRFDPLLDSTGGFNGPFDVVPNEVGRSVELRHPYAASPITMNDETMRSRLYRGMNVVELEADRILDDETMHLRIPRRYTPRVPIGLVVWASPTPDGRVPTSFGPALDRLDLACIGVDDAGNDRDVPDKFQLYFDAIATAATRVHLDLERVYIVGMSGGGKVASILTICFPDVFAGAMPIVGLATHGRLPADVFGAHGDPYFARPGGTMLRTSLTRRIAPMTGPADFNYNEMKARTDLLVKEKFDVRFFDYADMAHTMPTPDRFEEALYWIDRPRRDERRGQEAEAQMLLAAYFEERDDRTPRTEVDREALAEVLQTGPFTPAAWRALELLRATP